MPFDGTHLTSRDRRRILIEALRGELPEGFEWDFTVILSETEGCGTAGCAMGLAQQIGLIPDAEEEYQVMAAFGLSEEQYEACFYGAGMGVPLTQITPQMVADVLEKLP